MSDVGSSQYSDIDIEKVQRARLHDFAPKSELVRQQELTAKKGVEFYKITRKAKEMSALDDDDDSEAALIRKFRNEQQEKLWLAAKIRDRMQRLIRVEQKIREFDVDHLQKDQMEELNNLMGAVNSEWQTLKDSLEQKFKFCR